MTMDDKSDDAVSCSSIKRFTAISSALKTASRALSDTARRAESGKTIEDCTGERRAVEVLVKREESRALVYYTAATIPNFSRLNGLAASKRDC